MELMFHFSSLTLFAMWYEWEIISKLSDSDVGKWFTHINVFAWNESGKLKSYNNDTQTAFIVFKCNDNWDWDHWKDYTAQSCSYMDLASWNSWPWPICL